MTTYTSERYTVTSWGTVVEPSPENLDSEQLRFFSITEKVRLVRLWRFRCRHGEAFTFGTPEDADQASVMLAGAALCIACWHDTLDEYS